MEKMDLSTEKDLRTIEDWIKLCKDTKVPGACPITFSVVPMDEDRVVVTGHLNITAQYIPDGSINFRPGDTFTVTTNSIEKINTTYQNAVHYLLQLAKSLLFHELREQFMHKDIRVFDPHKGQKK